MTSSDDGNLVVCAVQVAMRTESESLHEATHRALALLDRIAAQQAAANKPAIDLYVLPELAPIGYSEDSFAKYLPRTRKLQNELVEMDGAFAKQAIKLQAHICYGTIGWKEKEKDDASSLTIRQKVVDPTRSTIAIYDKIHLCDFGDCAETRFFDVGVEPVSFAIKGFRFGLIICADMRYPELSRRLTRDECVDVILQPAAFNRDMTFRTWTSFRETRAVENSVYFVAVNYGGPEYGASSIVPPWVDEHHEPLVASTTDECLIGTLRRDELDWARENMPFHKALMSMKGPP